MLLVLFALLGAIVLFARKPLWNSGTAGRFAYVGAAILIVMLAGLLAIERIEGAGVAV